MDTIYFTATFTDGKTYSGKAWSVDEFFIMAVHNNIMLGRKSTVHIITDGNTVYSQFSLHYQSNQPTWTARLSSL